MGRNKLKIANWIFRAFSRIIKPSDKRSEQNEEKKNRCKRKNKVQLADSQQQRHQQYVNSQQKRQTNVEYELISTIGVGSGSSA